MREELKKVMKFWLDLGADGFRVDLAASLIRNDPDHQVISALWHYYRSWLESRSIPKRSLISEWSDPAVAIPAGFHIDSLLQFGKPLSNTPRSGGAAERRRPRTSLPSSSEQAVATSRLSSTNTSGTTR